MLFIVAHHYVVNSGLTAMDGPMMAEPDNVKTIYLWSFGMWGKVGINCFMMITGYFMCKSAITFEKFLKLILQIYLYRFVIYAIFLVAGYEVVTVPRLVKLFIPIWGLNSNFTSCFIIFWLTIPFWNILVQNMTKQQHTLLLVLLLGCYTVLGSVPGFIISFNYVTWFGVIYLIASYIRLYPHPCFFKKKLWGWLTVSSILLALVSMFVMLKMYGSGSALFFVADSNKILALTVAVSSFLFFKNIKLPYSRLINTISASTFGVLLLHANSDSMRVWLWKDIVDCVGHYTLSLGWLVLYSLGIVLCIYFICVLIDMTRIRFIEKPFFKWFENICCKKTN